MRKIPTLFVRDEMDRRYVTDVVTPGCEWVIAGAGTPTIKYDGTCVMRDEDGAWWARREVKAGKTPPGIYLPISTDDVTGKTVGWEPIGQSGFAKFHAEAVGGDDDLAAGTYELIGPKVNGNPERRESHELIRHGQDIPLVGPARTFDAIREWFQWKPEVEGLVYWEHISHASSRMVKIKGRDFRP